jgi:hypothetical protein
MSLHPLVQVSLEDPITSTQKFITFFYNETARLTDRVFKCINKEIDEIQEEIIQKKNVVESCKDLLLRIWE